MISWLRRWSGPLSILAVGAWMLRRTWLTWPDPIVDFGRELYVPWRLLEGDRLYADIAYFNGPLSPHLNALWFRIDGVGLASLLHLNALVLAGVCALLYALLREISNRFAATAGCIVFLVLFGFGQLTGLGNYNWMSPYSHEMTHGIALSLVSIALGARFARGGGRVRVAASGLAAGLVLLTKAEVFVAGATASALALALAIAVRGRRGTTAAADAATWVAALSLPALLATALLARSLPFDEALRGALSVWVHAFEPRNLAQPFYRRIAGTDDVPGHLLRLLAVAAGSAAVLLPAAALAQAVRFRGPLRIVYAAAVGALWSLAFVLAAERFPWSHWIAPLPLWLALVFAWVAHGARRRTVGRERDVLALSLLAFAFLLLLKMLLNVRIAHYGFGLAMPGTVLLVVAMLAWIPAAITRRGGTGAAFAAAAAAIWIGITVGHYVLIGQFVDEKTVAVGRGDDRFLADGRGAALNEALARLERELGPGDTLATFVDCEMLNYLSRRRSPVPYLKFIPQELVLFGEDRVMEALRRTPPDYVAVVHADTAEYGPRFFGRDYGLAMRRWIDEQYAPLGDPIGAPPMQGEHFGISLLRRREGPAS